MMAVAAGLGGVLLASAWAFEGLRWVGVAYLAGLGWRLLRQRLAPMAADDPSPAPFQPRAATVMGRSFTVAVTDPKGYLFFWAVLAAVFMAIDGAVLLAYAGAGAAGWRRLGGSSRWHWIDRCSGLILLGVAVMLALWRGPPH
jgi:threonine/homoserine/homoserine lactone efflux protein